MNIATSIIPDWTSDKGFEQIFKSYYNPLHKYSLQLLQDDMQAEEIVQDVFMELWQNRMDKYNQIQHLQAYLYKMVHNKSLNIVQHEKVKQKYAQFAKSHYEETIGYHQQIDARQLQLKIREALQSLPERCSLIFHKCRFEEKSYKEIAAELNIAVKTVENQMSKALKQLRLCLKDYLVLLLLLILFKHGGGM